MTVLFSCKGFSQSEERTALNEELQVGKKIDKLGNGVTRVFHDSKNNYWFSHKGVVKYDGNTFIQFTTDDGLYANRVRDIQEDHLGNIYFDTGEGINKFNGKTIEKLVVTDSPSKAKDLNSTDLWFAGNWNMNGTYRYDGQNLYHLKLPKNELEEETKHHSAPTNTLYSNYTTFKDKQGNIWMGGSTFGACRFDGSNFLWVSEREMTEIDPGPSMGVRSIVQDAEGNLYFASNVSSKYRISELDGQPTYEKLPGIDTSQEPNADWSCISMIIDNEGSFWMAQYEGGVWKYDGESFTHYPILINDQEAQLFSIYKDQSGVIWLGTHNAGTWKFDGEDFSRFEPETSKD